MRRLTVLSLVACAGCSQRVPDTAASTAATAKPAAVAKTTAADGMRVAEAKNSISAAEARATVVRYLARIKRRDFAAARLL